jgi:hypothetical protein
VTVPPFPAGPWLNEAIEQARQAWPHAADYPGCGFSLFLDHADDHLANMIELAEQQPADGEDRCDSKMTSAN